MLGLRIILVYVVSALDYTSTHPTKRKMKCFGGQVAADPAPADEDAEAGRAVKEEDANQEEDLFANNVEVKVEDANSEEDPFAGNVEVKEDLPTLNNLTHHNRVPLAFLSPCHH